MADKKKKEKLISYAELFSGVGFFIFTVLTFIGFTFNNSMVESGFFTALILLAAFFALKGLIRMKKAETRMRFWKTVEIICAVVLLALFVFLFNRPMYKTIFSYSEKSTLQPMAVKDLDSLEKLFDMYEQQESNAIIQVVNSLKQVTGLSDSRFDDNAKYHLNCFFGKTNVSNNDIDNYRDAVLNARLLSMNQDGTLIADDSQDHDYMTFKTEALSRIARIRSAVEKWSLTMVPQFSAATGDYSIQKLCLEIPEELSTLSHWRPEDGYPMKFTLVRSSSDANKWSVGEALEYDYHELTCHLSKRISGFSGSVGTYLLSILINLLMAFVYLMAYRSKKVYVKRTGSGIDEIGGGRLL